jgi:thioredoxin 1
MRTIIKFSASWCGTCKLIKPIWNRLKDSNPDIEFKEVDVDLYPDIDNKYGISNLPHFSILVDGVVIDGISTSKEENIEQLLTTLKCNN